MGGSRAWHSFQGLILSFLLLKRGDSGLGWRAGKQLSMASQLTHRPLSEGSPEVHGEPPNLLVALEKVGMGPAGSVGWGESHVG